MRILIYLCVLSLFFSECPAIAQTLPVGTRVLDDYYRRLQLEGKLDSTVSFNIRPLGGAAMQVDDLFDPDGTMGSSSAILLGTRSGNRLQLMPLNWENQYVSSFPYGWNDGSMIPAVGFQTRLSAGIYAKYKFVSIQLRPEFVTAQNKGFEGFSSESENAWRLWYQYMNYTDMPERFGTSAYSKLFAGQSYFRLTFDPISFGVSTENLWWGPGMRNSLLLSNTAPGFLHGTLNTSKPIRTAIGSFEGQLVGGRLEASGFPPRVMTGDPSDFERYYRPKQNDWRYFSGISVSYQPRWVPGLSLGAARSEVIDGKNLEKGIGAYFPLFDRFSKSTTEIDSLGNDIKQADAYVSIFARWLIPDSKAEVYFEWGRNDAAWDLRDLMVQLDHTRAYTVGFRKLLDFDYIKGGDQLQVWVEATQMERPKTANLRLGPTWYVHQSTPNGYTNYGQPVGAGLGLASNVQMLHVSWIRGMKQLGFQVERLAHNNDFFYDAIGDLRRNWVDLSFGLDGNWDYRHFLFFGKLQTIKAYNYQYRLELNDPDLFWNFNSQDKWNLLVQIGTSYRF